MKILMILVMFVVIGGLFIVNQHNLNLGNKEDVAVFVSLYVTWADSLFNNLRTLTGHVVNLEWLPKNNTG